MKNGGEHARKSWARLLQSNNLVVSFSFGRCRVDSQVITEDFVSNSVSLDIVGGLVD